LKNNQTQKEAAGAFRKAAPYLNIVYSFFGGIILFGYFGHWLDEKLETHSWLLIAGVFLGFALGFYRMIKVINELDREKK
jgi:F0F1-type ATP synthase assembly protein I